MPAFSKDDNNKPAENEVGVKERSNFLQMGKYFLLLLLLLLMAGGAYLLVDLFYEDIYAVTIGRTSDSTVTYVIDEIIANPAGNNASRFLVVEIGLVLSSSEDAGLVEENLMHIKDRINEVLSTKEVNELIRPEGRNELRVEIAEEINDAIGVRSVRNLYFIKYVMQ